MKKTTYSKNEFCLSLKDKTKILFQNYQIGMPVIESLKDARFDTIDEFASKLMYHHQKDHRKDQDFLFTINMKPKTENYLKEYLIKNKKFVFNYLVSRGYFLDSHIFQFYLQYIPHKLTDVEKSIFLDAYIEMVTNLRGNDVSVDKRKRLEKRLNINQE